MKIVQSVLPDRRKSRSSPTCNGFIRRKAGLSVLQHCIFGQAYPWLGRALLRHGSRNLKKKSWRKLATEKSSDSIILSYLVFWVAWFQTENIVLICFGLKIEKTVWTCLDMFEHVWTTCRDLPWSYLPKSELHLWAALALLIGPPQGGRQALSSALSCQGILRSIHQGMQCDRPRHMARCGKQGVARCVAQCGKNE